MEKHMVTLENRERMTITDIREIDSFDEIDTVDEVETTYDSTADDIDAILAELRERREDWFCTYATHHLVGRFCFVKVYKNRACFLLLLQIDSRDIGW